MSTQLAYIAGLFDGEGSISRYQTMRKGRKNPTWVIRCEINMTDQTIIKWLHDTLGFGSFGWNYKFHERAPGVCFFYWCPI